MSAEERLWIVRAATRGEQVWLVPGKTRREAQAALEAGDAQPFNHHVTWQGKPRVVREDKPR